MSYMHEFCKALAKTLKHLRIIANLTQVLKETVNVRIVRRWRKFSRSKPRG